MAGRYATPPKRELPKQFNGREFKMRHFGTLCLAIIGASILSFPVAAKQKTVKACQAEWRANKADNQAKGITEKAYVAQCRAGGSAANPAPAAAASTASAVPAATQKAVKACRDEWRANKADNQAKGITEKAYVGSCRAGTTAAQPAPASTTASSPGAAPAPTPSAAPTATVTPTGANQYATEAQAKRRCGVGTVVWANLDSNIYHFASYKNYGHTKTGAYMCESDATSQGMRAAKNEKHP